MMTEQVLLSNNVGKPLNDKVALLLDIDGNFSRSLAIALATYGADIAILFGSNKAKTVQTTKMVVENLGKRCLIVPVENSDRALPDEPINKVQEEYGQIDIFIDYSSLSWASFAQGRDSSNGQIKQTGRTANSYVTIDIMAAVLDQMIGHEQHR